MATGEMSLRSARAALAGAVPERGLVERCRQGDPQAFARLVALHEGMVFNLAARLLGDPEEAKDVAQDVFLQVYRTLGRFEGRSSLKTWIYRIVVNQCHNRQRCWRRRRKDRSRPSTSSPRAEEAQPRAPRRAGEPVRARCGAGSVRARVQAALLGSPSTTARSCCCARSRAVVRGDRGHASACRKAR